MEVVRVRQQPRTRSGQYGTTPDEDDVILFFFGATPVSLAPTGTVFRLPPYYFLLASRAGCAVVLEPSISRTTSSIISRPIEFSMLLTDQVWKINVLL
jgi:hypothetical protein